MTDDANIAAHDDAAPPDGPEPSPDLDALRAEVAAEQPTPVPDAAEPEEEPLPDGAVVVQFDADTAFAVLHPLDWPSSANEDFAYRNYGQWVRKAFVRQADVDRWEEMDPTNRQVVAFVSEWLSVSGTGEAIEAAMATQGKARPSGGSSRSSAGMRGQLRAIS